MDIATLGIAVESRQVATANDNLARLKREAGGAERATKGFEAGAKKASTATGQMADQAKRAHSVFLRLSGILSVIGVSLGIGALVRYADTWSDINARVGLAIGNMDAAGIVMDRLSDVARRTYSALNLTAEGFIRNATVLKELGKSTAEQLDFTESLNLAMVVSGAKADRAARLQEALGKAMALGQLRGEELNSVIQVGGRVAEVLAEELGIGVNQLRKFGMDGKITGDVIYNALTKRLESLREEAELMPATIGDAFTLLGNSMLTLIGTFDQTHGISERLATAIIGIADSLGTLVKVVALAGVGLLTYFAPAILSGIAVGLGYIGAAGVAAFRAIGVAIAANPLGALILAVNLVLTALFLFRDKIAEVFGHDLAGYVIRAGDFLINSFEAAFEDVKFIWANLPDVLGAAMIGAANAVIRGINGMVQGAAQGIDWLIEKINKIPGVNVGKIGAVSPLGEMDNPFAGQLAGALAEHAAAIDSIMSQDRLGQWIGATGEATAANLDLAASGSAVAAALTKEQEAVRDLIKDLEFEVSLFGKSAMQREVDINLRKAGTAATEKQRESITRLTETLFKLREAYDFVADVTKGFFTDLKSGLQNGEGIWQSFASAATNALDKISNKLIDMALDQAINALFKNILGALGGGLGGGFGSVPGMLYAKGGIQSGAGISAFSNSIVDRPTVFPFARGVGMMGEAGPEAIMPLKRGPDGTLGVAAGGGSTGGNVYHIDARGAQRGVGEEIKAALQAYDRNVAPHTAVDAMKRHHAAGGSI